jgi:hypothetical protein
MHSLTVSTFDRLIRAKTHKLIQIPRPTGRSPLPLPLPLLPIDVSIRINPTTDHPRASRAFNSHLSSTSSANLIAKRKRDATARKFPLSLFAIRHPARHLRPRMLSIKIYNKCHFLSSFPQSRPFKRENSLCRFLFRLRPTSSDALSAPSSHFPNAIDSFDTQN